MNSQEPATPDQPQQNSTSAGVSGSSYDASRLLKTSGLHTSLVQFARSTGLAVTLYDTAGRIAAGPIVPTPFTEFLALAGCWMSKEGVEGLCVRQERALAETVMAGDGDMRVGIDESLGIIAIPLHADNVCIGAVITGWSFTTFPDPVIIDRLARTIATPYAEFWQIARQQQPVGLEKLNTYGALLRTLCALYIRERLERQREEDQSAALRTLCSSAEHLAAATTVEEIGAITAGAACELAGSNRARLLVADEKGTLHVIASRGYQDNDDEVIPGNNPITSTLHVPVRSADERLLGRIELGIDPRAESRNEDRLATLAAQTAVALQKTLLIADLRRERESLTRANRIKDEFLATLSHELRTPLTPILNWTGMLKETSPDDVEMFNMGIETIERNARQELHLIEELLDLTRVLNDKVVLDLEPVNAREALSDAASTARSLAADRDISIHLDMVQNLPHVLADKRRLNQILNNLVSNAVKFTPDGGSITLGGNHEGNRVVFSITDTGAGIPAHVLPTIFDRFHQADSTTTRRYGGLGIGLSVVRGLVELHGGTVEADSDGEGKGATFRVSLPVTTEKQARKSQGASPSDSELTAEERGRFRVLIVDDAADTLASIGMMMQRAGFVVDQAASVDEALDTLRTTAPDVIVSDLSMPERDGYDLIRTLRNDDTLPAIPMIAVTGMAAARDRDLALGAGFVEHLAKPIDADALIALLDTIVKHPLEGNS